MLFCKVSVAGLSNQQQHAWRQTRCFFKVSNKKLLKMLKSCVCVCLLYLKPPLEIKASENKTVWHLKHFEIQSGQCFCFFCLCVTHSPRTKRYCSVHFCSYAFKTTKALTRLKKGHLFQLNPVNTASEWWGQNAFGHNYILICTIWRPYLFRTICII